MSARRPRPHLSFPRLLAGCLTFLLAAHPALALDKTLESLGVSFHVTDQDGVLTITPSGLADNRAVQLKPSGRLVKVQVLDLDADGSPEVYLFFRDDARSASGHVLAFHTAGRQALRPIVLPPLTAAQLLGYAGHDEFAFMQGSLMRRFPVPEKKVREIQYRLSLKPSGLALDPVHVVEF